MLFRRDRDSGKAKSDEFRREKFVKIAIGFVLSFIIGAGCSYFDIPAASPPVIPGALIVLAMTLGYSSMDKVLIRKNQAAITRHLCGGPTGLPQSAASPKLEHSGLRVPSLNSDEKESTNA